MLKALEQKEESLGITPDAEVAELMSGMHHGDDPSCSVALTLQVRNHSSSFCFNKTNRNSNLCTTASW